MGARLKIAAAVVACAGMLGVGWWGGTLIQERSLGTLSAAEFGQCHRQNVGRITGNRNNYSQYKLWGAALTLFEYGESQPAIGPKPSAQSVVLLKALLSAMSTQLRTESWTPLSNCVDATDHPVSYVPPAAVAFSKGPPPLSAFTIGPGE